MILIVGGTSDSREIACRLKEHQINVLISSATSNGYKLATLDGLNGIQGRLDCQGIIKTIDLHSIKVLVDASHPYAEEVSKNAAAACIATGVPYIRYSRPVSIIKENPLLVTVSGYKQAVEKAFEIGNSIFLAAGSKNAGLFIETAQKTGKRLIVRVTPEPDIINMLIKLGVNPADIVAMQGPFNEEINKAMFRYFKSDILVTKESGEAGGFNEKISAASKLGITSVVIQRPSEPAGAITGIEETVHKALSLVKT